MTNSKQVDPAYVETLVDALDHIARVCRGSRTQTRRIRWIEMRARCAIEGGQDWREAEIPKTDPTLEALRGMIEGIYPVARMAIKFLEQYEPDDLDADQAADLKALREFDARVREHMFWLARRFDAEDEEERAATA